MKPKTLFRRRKAAPVPGGGTLARVKRAILRRVGEPCLLCGKPARVSGLWFPSPRCNCQLGAAAGKLRVVSYSVCERHALPSHTAAIEEAILARFHAELAQLAAN